MRRPLEGILPAIHTAFDAREEIDFGVQRELIRRLIAQGVHGFFVCGTSAEFPFLSIEEREKIADVIAAESGGRAAMVVQVGGTRPRDAVRLAQHAERLGASAVSAVPPYYYSYRADSIVDYLREIASSTALPFFYYHIPERTGVAMDERFVERLLQVPNLAGLKYSHGDLVFQERLQQLAGPKLRIFCGFDELLLPSLLAGACGAIGSTYNFLAPVFVPLWKAFHEGKIADAQALQRRANKIITVLARYPGIAGSKEALRLLGVDVGLPRAPQSRLHASERVQFEREMLAAGFQESAHACEN
jgi:N-acetylneuraminate lyase